MTATHRTTAQPAPLTRLAQRRAANALQPQAEPKTQTGPIRPLTCGNGAGDPAGRFPQPAKLSGLACKSLLATPARAGKGGGGRILKRKSIF